MAKNNNEGSGEQDNSNARLVTTDEDKAGATKWFLRARDLGDKRQYDYAIEYYVNGLELWPDAVEDACKPLHGCAVARRQTGGKKPGLKDSMKRSLNDKNAKQALLNALWLFGRDPDSLNYIEGIAKNASRLRAEDTAYWAANVLFKALESAPKASAKQIHVLANLLEELGDRAGARQEGPFAVEIYGTGVDALSLWKRRAPKDDRIDVAIKNVSTKLTILKGRYKDGESYRESISDLDEQMELHDEHRSVQSDDRIVTLVTAAEAEYQANPDDDGALRRLVDLLCRREDDADEIRAIGHLVDAFKRTDDYRWKQQADDIRMKQLHRKRRELQKGGDPEKFKEHRIAQLRFELAVYKERLDRYPTDNRLRFEYGVRNFQASRFDLAIPLLQAARIDPKNRAACGMYLGRCFLRKRYHDQAIITLKESIREYEFSDDELAMTMLYWLGRAEEDSGDVEAARKTFGKILQVDYNFGDARARLDALPK